MLLNKARLIYILLAILSLTTSFFVIAFGLKFIGDGGLYALHLQALVVLSSAGLLDYLYINRLERLAVSRYKMAKKILDRNIFFIFIPIIIMIVFWGNIFFYFSCLALIRHFLNLRRGVEVINGNLNLSYLSYLGQIGRNLMVFIPGLDDNSYFFIFVLSFSFEFMYVFFNKVSVCGVNYRIKIKVRLIKSNSFLYRFFYIINDVLFRIVFPSLMLSKDAEQYLYLVNMLLLPVAGYSLVGALVHAHILRGKIRPSLKILSILCFASVSSLFVVYTIVGVNLEPPLLILFSLVASLKFIDQVLISYQVSVGNFKLLKLVFLTGFILSMLFLSISFLVDVKPLVFVLVSMVLGSSLLFLSGYRPKEKIKGLIE